jgi:hypothetical protein
VIGSLASGPTARADNPLDALGTVDQLTDIVDEHGVTRVVLSAQDVDDLDLQGLLLRCRALALKVEIDDVEGITVFGLNPP